MVGWHHQLDGHEFKQTLEASEGQGRLVCCSPWDYMEDDSVTEQQDSRRVASLPMSLFNTPVGY